MSQAPAPRTGRTAVRYASPADALKFRVSKRRRDHAILDLPCHCAAYVDVLTRGRWNALGYVIRSGESACYRAGKNATTPVFCRCQVALRDADSAAPAPEEWHPGDAIPGFDDAAPIAPTPAPEPAPIAPAPATPKAPTPARKPRRPGCMLCVWGCPSCDLPRDDDRDDDFYDYDDSPAPIAPEAAPEESPESPESPAPEDDAAPDDDAILARARAITRDLREGRTLFATVEERAQDWRWRDVRPVLYVNALECAACQLIIRTLLTGGLDNVAPAAD